MLSWALEVLLARAGDDELYRSSRERNVTSVSPSSPGPECAPSEREEIPPTEVF